MAYKKQTWVDLETPLDAEHMNHIEDGIGSLSEEIANLKEESKTQTKTSTGTVVKCFPVSGSDLSVNAPDAETVWHGGKNLINISNDNTGEWDLWYETPVDKYKAYRIDNLFDKFKLLPKGVPLCMTYEPWGNGTRDTLTGTTFIRYTDGTSTGYLNEGTSFTLPPDKEIDGVILHGLKGNTEGGYRNFQVEYGETSTAYEVYRGANYTLVNGETIIPALDGMNVLYANSGDVSVTYLTSSASVGGAEGGRTSNIALVFGEGINLKYETPEIAALPDITAANRLTHYYGLYDALVAAHPDYVQKVDCDAEAVAAGIAKPDHMADYPIYMYKFIPAYTSNSNTLNGVTDASRLKVFILGGVHNEMMAIWDVYNALRLICEEWENDDNLEALRWQCEFYVMPLSNPWGVANNSRLNYNGVDLNRNSPTTDWRQTSAGTSTYSGDSAGSEYETKVFVHYMKDIKPHVFMDHHNTNNGTDLGVVMYFTTLLQANADVAADHLSKMSRRWKKRYSTVFPQDNTTIFGGAILVDPGQTVGGSRERYGYESGARSYTVETNMALGYDNNQLSENAHNADAIASTVATDGFINFLLLALRNAAQRISAGLID